MREMTVQPASRFALIGGLAILAACQQADPQTQSSSTSTEPAATPYWYETEEIGLLIRDLYERDPDYCADEIWLSVHKDKNFARANELFEERFARVHEEPGGRIYTSSVNAFGNARGDDRLERLDTLNEWIENSPNPRYALMARAEFYKAYAWHFRGGGLASEVTEEGWALFREHLMNAKNDLDRAAALEPKDPDPHVAMIGVAMGLGWKREAVQSLYDHAITLAPHHYGARRSFFLYLMPRWYGSEEELLAFSEECFAVADKYPIAATTGRFAYTAAWNAHRTTLPSMEDERIWARVDAVFQNAEKRYPKDLLIRADHAHAAQLGRHEKHYYTLFEEIGDRQIAFSGWNNWRFYHRSRMKAYAHVALHRTDLPFEVREGFGRRAIDLAPNYHWPYYALGRLYKKEEMWEPALSTMLNVVDLNEDMMSARKDVAEILEHLGRCEEAVVYATQVQESQKSSKNDLQRTRQLLRRCQGSL